MIRGSSASLARKDPPPSSLVALLWLSADGRIAAANVGARELWRVREKPLVGESLVALLAWEIVSQAPDWKQEQWDILVATARGCTLPVQAQPFGGGDAIPVLLTLEDATGSEPGYFAAIAIEEKPAETEATSSPPLEAASAVPSQASPIPPPVAPRPDASIEWLTNDAPVGWFDLDFRLGYAHYSPTWKRLLGYDDGDLPNTYDTWRRLLHEEDSAAAPDRVAKAPAPGAARSFTLEFRMQHRRGHYVWMQCMGVRHFTPAGELDRVLGLQFDISERKELEEETLGAEERLHRLSGPGFLGAFDLDFVKRSFWFSDAWRALFGLPPTDLSRLNEPLWPLLDVLPADRAQGGATAWLNEHRAGDDPLIEAVTMLHRDGRGIPILLGLARTYSRKKDLLRVVGFALPLNADATATRSGRPLPPAHLVAPTLDTLTEAVLVADALGNVVYMNERAERLTGRTALVDGLLKIPQAFPLVRRSDYQPAYDAVEIQLASGQPATLCADHALAPRPERSEPLPIVWSARQTWDTRGRIAGVVIVFRDPREMSLTPEELVRTNRLETLGHLAGGIATDYNNLLTTILGAISQAKENRDFSHLASAEKACLEATGLSRQLLSFSRTAPSPGIAIFAVGELLRDAVRMVATGCPATIVFDLPETLPTVSVDRSQLIQAFQNLVINAIEALPTDKTQGQIRFRASETELGSTDVPPLPAGRYVQIEIQDNGSGIAAENLERIFDPFFTTRKNSTGLGLATVLSIVRRHGGQVWVTSLPDAGATFTVFLPTSPVVSEPPAKAPPTLRFGTGRVLFMDDDPSICSLTASMLTSLDYTYDLAKNGEEAIALYRRYLNVGRPYDAVIMDLTVVGGMGGEECFVQLLQLHSDVRAIVASGYDDPELRKYCLDLGFIGYLSKPYRVVDLSLALRAALGNLGSPFST